MSKAWCLSVKLVLLVACLNLGSCKQDTNDKKSATTQSYEIVRGKTMGTTYSIQHDLLSQSLKTTIDSILIDINLSLSTYIDSSTISKINNVDNCQEVNILVQGKPSTTCLIESVIDSHFLINYNAASKIFTETGRSFDPTVMPLVNYWGFGYTEKKAITKVDSQKVSALKDIVGLDKWTLKTYRENFKVIKPLEAQIDFSAIAKGYAVDYLSEFLDKKGSKNFIVEIGGEVYAKGNNARNKAWTIGLNTPKENARVNESIQFVTLDNLGLASSGNYRNFYEVDGHKYGHEINPKTGYPEKNVLLGVSVIAPDCMTADAYATGFMVMGLDKTKVLVEQLSDVEACLFYANENEELQTQFSSGFQQFIKESMMNVPKLD